MLLKKIQAHENMHNIQQSKHRS